MNTAIDLNPVPSIDAAHHATIAQWRAEILAVPAANNLDGARLTRLTREFLASELAMTALAAGWSGVELFGVAQAEQADWHRRRDCLGLIPVLAFSSVAFRIAEITEDAAILVANRSNSHLRHPRLLPDALHSVGWWRHPSICEGAEND